MKNREKYADFLIECAIRGVGVAVTKDGKLCNCMDLECGDCLFGDPSLDCVEMTRKWADAEYEEPEIDWSKVPVDTKMYVRNDLMDKWIPRYFSGKTDIHGEPLVFVGGTTSFSCDKDINRNHMIARFPFYKLAEDIE